MLGAVNSALYFGCVAGVGLGQEFASGFGGYAGYKAGGVWRGVCHVGPPCILIGCFMYTAVLILGGLCAHLVFFGCLGYVISFRAPA